MNECNSIEANDRIDLSEQIKFRLDEISKLKNYFHEEINQRKSCSRKLSNYVTIFGYIDKAQSIVRSSIGIASTMLTLFFSLTTGIVKKLLSATRKKKKKHDKILTLAKSKLNSIETLIPQALIDMDISHKEFVTISKEKDKYEKMKDNLRSENREYKISSVKSKI